MHAFQTAQFDEEESQPLNKGTRARNDGGLLSQGQSKAKTLLHRLKGRCNGIVCTLLGSTVLGSTLLGSTTHVCCTHSVLAAGDHCHPVADLSWTHHFIISMCYITGRTTTPGAQASSSLCRSSNRCFVSGGMHGIVDISEMHTGYPAHPVCTFPHQVGDWGRRGDYNQSSVAAAMAAVAQRHLSQFVISTGDNFCT